MHKVEEIKKKLNKQQKPQIFPLTPTSSFFPAANSAASEHH